MGLERGALWVREVKCPSGIVLPPSASCQSQLLGLGLPRVGPGLRQYRARSTAAPEPRPSRRSPPTPSVRALKQALPVATSVMLGGQQAGAVGSLRAVRG